MNSEKKFIEKSKEIAKKFNLSIYEVYQKYMFERFLERISVSDYQDNFILKGGILLSAIMGIENRSTRDIDTTIKGINVDQKYMINVLNEILSIDLKDGVKFDIVNIKDIREEDEYSGNRYSITGRIGNTKIQFDIDISTGDVITPRELKYRYNSIFENKSFLLSVYNISTIFAEKLETILKKGKSNSRMKDFYDLYYFITYMKHDLNIKEIKEAIYKTFERRGSSELLLHILPTLTDIQNSNLMNERWNIYSNKSNYAKNIAFFEVIKIIQNFLKTIFEEN